MVAQTLGTEGNRRHDFCWNRRHLEASGRLEASGGPLNQEVHSLSLKCSQTAAGDHSTAEWRRSEARSPVKHTVRRLRPCVSSCSCGHPWEDKLSAFAREGCTFALKSANSCENGEGSLHKVPQNIRCGGSALGCRATVAAIPGKTFGQLLH